MLNFTSALYLGLQHPSESLRPWQGLTLGVPAVLAEPATAESVAAGMASAMGYERALLAPSTLHLFWDLFGTETFRSRHVFLDSGSYPIAGWGVERAAARNASVTRFTHYDPRSLRLRLEARRPTRPVVVCDGVCPACGRAAPIAEFVEAARKFGGTLLIDDTQGVGILGDRSRSAIPYGSGGGGVMRWHGISDPNVLAISSLAKGFGVPIAVLSGSREAVSRFQNESETRVHCSPPSVAVIHAAENALRINEREGDALRSRLVNLVRKFRRQLGARRVGLQGGLFPMQSLRAIGGETMANLHERLLRAGIRTVFHQDRHDGVPRVTFLITARHMPDEINTAVDAVCQPAEDSTPSGLGGRYDAIRRI